MSKRIVREGDGVKVSLVQPKAFHSWEALNIGYLKAYASQWEDGIDWRFFSGYFDSDKEIVNGSLDSDFIAFSATTPQTVHVRDLLHKLRSHGWDGKAVLGGVHASAQPNHLLGLFDYVVKGEGEMSLLRILNGTVKPGIVESPNMRNIDFLPPPDRQFIKQERNLAVTEKNDNMRIGAIFSSRGCPFRCKFCSSHEVWTRKARLHSAKRVFSEMQSLRDDWGIQFIKFSDDTFTLDEARVFELCDLIRAEKFAIPWGCNIRANTSDKLLEAMTQAHCQQVWVGAESGSPRILKEMMKGITIKQVAHIFNKTKQLGLYRRVYFMVGWPTETERDIESTKELARIIDADQYGFSVLCPYPNNIGFNPSMLDSIDWSIMDEYGNPYARTETISHDRLIEHQTELIREFNDKMCFRQRGEVERPTDS